MIYFLHGPDTYRSRKRLHELVGAYQKKWGGVLGFTRLDAEEDDLNEKLPPATATLFRQRTLLVIENAIAAKKDYTKLLEVKLSAWKNDNETFVVFWDREIPEKKKKLAKLLEEYAAKKQEFSLPDRALLRRLVAEEAKERGIALGRDAIETLVSLGDSWAAVRELEKIELLHERDKRQETRDRGRTSVGVQRSAFSVKPYHLTDAVIEGRRDALRIFYTLEATSAVEDIMLLGAFVNAVRGMLLLQSAGSSVERSRIVREEGMHSFVAQKLTAQAQRFSFDDLKKIYQRLLAADILAKTGAHPVHSIVQRIVETGLRFDLPLR